MIQVILGQIIQHVVKMINEDLLVSKLTVLGITEIFTENLTIEDKINLFSKATLIIVLLVEE